MPFVRSFAFALSTVVFVVPAVAAADASPTACPSPGGWNGPSTNQNGPTSWPVIEPRIAPWVDDRMSYNIACYDKNQFGIYRTDCSGFVSLAWGLNQSYDTHELNPNDGAFAGITHAISWAEIVPGDALVVDTADDSHHHVALVVDYDASTESGTLAEESGADESGGEVVPTVEVAFSHADAYWAMFTPIRYNDFTPGVVTTSTSVTPNLAANGDFNKSTGGWSRTGSTNLVRYNSGTGGATAYEGAGYAATNTATAGGTIETDVNAAIAVGDTYCVSAQLTSLGSAGGTASMALWMLGGTNENASKAVGGLEPGVWTPAQTCVTATHAHTSLRVQFYLTPGKPTIGIDAVNLNEDLVANGGFNASAAGWNVDGAGTHYVRYASGSGGSTAYEGAGWLATNAPASGGSVVSDRAISIKAGDTYCVSAQMTTAGSGLNGEATLAIWFMGGVSNEGSSKAVALHNDSVWTPATTCATAKSAHSTLRVQIYPKAGGPTVGIDAVNLTRNIAPSGGLNESSTGWTRGGSTNLVDYASGTGATAYEGSGYLATNTSTAGGSVYTDIALAVKAGESFCVSAHAVTLGTGSGGGGALAIWLIGGGATDGSSKGIGDLPGNSQWQPLTTCVTATSAHTTMRLQFYPTPNKPTVGLDAVTVD
jgi:hypothetical protein